MQVERIDNSVDLYDWEKIQKEIQDREYKSFAEHFSNIMVEEDVKSVTAHKPKSEIIIPKGKIVRLNNKYGEIIEQSDRKYIVQEDGSWKKIK